MSIIPAAVEEALLRTTALPSGWSIRRVGDVASLVNGFPFSSERFSKSVGERVIRIRDLKGDDDLLFYDGKPEESARMRDGDVVIGMDGDFEAVLWNRGPTLLNQRLCLLRSKRQTDRRFLFYVLAVPLKIINDLTYFTTVKHLSSSDVRAIRFASPPLTTQGRLADHLDAKTAAIDALTAKKEQQLALLAEKRAAIINEAVTKGLDPSVAMKDSGVPWIGQIPVHWTAMRLKYVCKLETGHTPSKTEPSYWIEEECVIPWVSLNDTKMLAVNDYVSDTALKISPKGMANSSAHFIDAGAVVFTRDATIGLAAITTLPMAVSQHIIAWVCGPRLSNRFLLRVIAAMRNDLDKLTFGSTLKTIGMDDVNEMATPLPPVEEQERIVERLDDKLGRLQTATERLTRQIGLLREYRQAVITAAVTGQVAPSEAE